jgi:hypothetical protein
MSEEIFVNTGTSFQQPYIARQPASGRTPAIGTVEARTPTNVQTPFTYSNRTPFTYRSPVSAQQPYIAQGRQPGTYARQGQTPLTYRNPVNGQQPYIANGQQPGTYARQGQTPFTYRNPVNGQTPYIANGQQPGTYARQGQTPYPYIANSQTPYIANSQTPFTYSSSQNVQIPFAWGSLSGTVDIDVDIQNDQDLNPGDGWSFASTNFTVLSSGAAGGTIQVSSLSADDSYNFASQTATTSRNLTYTGGLDSLEGRFVYTNANFNTEIRGGDASVAMIWHKTTKMTANAQSYISNVPHNDSGMTIANGSVVHGITTEFSSSTSDSGWVSLGRNAFTNTGDCSMILSAACYSGGLVDDYGDALINGTWKLELRANGNSSAFTVWNKTVNIKAFRFQDASS